jgi:hypothetical protein
MTTKTILLLGLSIPAMFTSEDTACSAAPPAQVFMMQFSVTGFVNDSGSGVAVPTDPVVGTIVYQATGIHDPIQSFDSISMTIDGHSYAADELGYYRFPTPAWDMIGGLTGGVDTLHNQTDDFIIRWYRDSLTPNDFIYTSSGRNGTFSSEQYYPVSFTSFTITAIPEPAAGVLLFLGAAMFSIRKLKRHSARRS